MKLTNREKEVLKMCCLPPKEIAKRLFISQYTVRDHIKNIYNKFVLSDYNKAMLIAKALKQAVIKIDEIIME